MRGPARVSAPRAPARRPATGPTSGRSAPVLRLQRTIGNRALGSALRRTAGTGAPAPSGRALARDPSPTAVDDAQLADEQSNRTKLASFAQTCLTVPSAYRDGMVHALLELLILAYIPDSRPDIKETAYQGGQTGIVGTDAGKVVIGDDALTRIAGGSVDQVGAELRGTTLALGQAEFKAHKPAIVWVGGERVRVASAQEAADAQRIVTLLKDTYGVAFDSVAARRAARQDKAERGSSPERQRASDVVPWTYMDLRDLELAFQHFAPILGRARSKSSRASTPQEVVRVGRLSSDAMHDADEHKEEGEYLKDAHLIALYQSQPTVVTDPDEATLVHEIAHAVFGPLRDRFVADIGYWTGRSAPHSDGKLEAPPTPYGAKNADEDLADSVMLFFTAPDALKGGVRGKHTGEPGNPCPKRFAWIAKEVARWNTVASH